MRVVDRPHPVGPGRDTSDHPREGRARRPAVLSDLVVARTCYDHLAGQLGVALFDALVARGAIVPLAGDEVCRAGSRQPVGLGPAAADVFGQLGIDLEAIPHGRRPLATACLDWTERRPHLAGALGAAICDKLVANGWVRRRPGTRAVILTPLGRERLAELLGSCAVQVG